MGGGPQENFHFLNWTHVIPSLPLRSHFPLHSTAGVGIPPPLQESRAMTSRAALWDLGTLDVFLGACMHAKSLQSCPTLCDPMDSSPPGSSIHGIVQARILGCHALLQGDLPNPGIEPGSFTFPALAGKNFTPSAPCTGVLCWVGEENLKFFFPVSIF